MQDSPATPDDVQPLAQRLLTADSELYVSNSEVFSRLVFHYCLGIWLASASSEQDMHSYAQSADCSSLLSTQETDPVVVSADFAWTETGKTLHHC